MRYQVDMEKLVGIKVLFACLNCEACYWATQQRAPVRAAGSFRCQVCREEVYTWAGEYEYFDWRATEG